MLYNILYCYISYIPQYIIYAYFVLEIFTEKLIKHSTNCKCLLTFEVESVFSALVRAWGWLWKGQR